MTSTHRVYWPVDASARRWESRPIARALAALFLLILATACGGSAEPSVSIDSPEDGATVTSPVSVQVGVDGFELGPTTSEKKGVGHLHWAVDSCDTESGLEGGEDTFEAAPLTPGEHTICVKAFTSDHEELGASDEITVHVAGGATEPPASTSSEEGAVEHWAGVIDGQIKSGPDCTAARNRGRFQFDVAETGTVRGLGVVTSTEYTCTTPQGTSTIPAESSEFELSGKKGADTMTLTFSNGPLTVRIPYTGTSGATIVDQSVGEYIARSGIEIECIEGC